MSITYQQDTKNMNDKKGLNITLILMAFILGITLLRHFNFETLRFKMPALDILFLLAFIVSIYLIIKEYKEKRKK